MKFLAKNDHFRKKMETDAKSVAVCGVQSSTQPSALMYCFEMNGNFL